MYKNNGNNNNGNNTAEIWALIDDISGHNSQVLGVADALEMPYTTKKIAYNKSANKHNLFSFSKLGTLDKKNSDNIQGPWPKIIISCGRKSSNIAKDIKKLARKDGVKSFVVNLMWPGGWFAKGANLVAAPKHDRIHLSFLNKHKLIKTTGSANRITKSFLLQEHRIWKKTIGEISSPSIAILIGGDSRKTEINMEHAKTLVNEITKVASETNCSILATTSRRTSEKVSDFLEKEIKQRVGKKIFFHNFSKSRANPFYALLEIADIFIVTGDSISMCSEAATTGKPVFIFSPEGNAPEKHRAFHQTLYGGNYAYEFNSKLISKLINGERNNLHFPNKPLNSSEIIAAEIKSRLKLDQ